MVLNHALYIYVIVIQLGLYVGLLAVGAGSVSGSLTNFWEPIPHALVPHHPEYRRRDLVLWQLDMPCFADAQERIAPF